MPDLM